MSTSHLSRVATSIHSRIFGTLRAFVLGDERGVRATLEWSFGVAATWCSYFVVMRPISSHEGAVFWLSVAAFTGFATALASIFTGMPAVILLIASAIAALAGHESVSSILQMMAMGGVGLRALGFVVQSQRIAQKADHLTSSDSVRV